MKLNEIIGMSKAESIEDLLGSRKDGRFTKDGSDLVVSKNFSCLNTNLISLLGCPKEVKKDFFCSYNKLRSLIGGPRKVGADFLCSYNNLTLLEGCPEEIGGDFYCKYNLITSLKDIHKHLKKMNGGIIRAQNNPIKSHVLGLLKIPGCFQVFLDNTKVEKILNKYLPLGDLIDCQEELIEAGLEEFAQL